MSLAPAASWTPFSVQHDTLGFTPAWAPWLTANYQVLCHDKLYECACLGPDYYRIMAAMRAKTQGEGI